MAEQTGQESFEKFLSEQPAPAETVTLVGAVGRSARPGSFVLNAGGQLCELPIDAVHSYRVVGETSPRLVELKLSAARLDAAALRKPPLADLRTGKEVAKDPIHDKVMKDPVTEGVKPLYDGVVDPTQIDPALNPFILATPHHAPASTMPLPPGPPWQVGNVQKSPLIDQIKLAYVDRPTFKEPIKDPILDRGTVPEGIFDPTGGAANAGLAIQPLSYSAQAAYYYGPHTGYWWDAYKPPHADHPGGYPQAIWNLPGMMF